MKLSDVGNKVSQRLAGAWAREHGQALAENVASEFTPDVRDACAILTDEELASIFREEMAKEGVTSKAKALALVWLVRDVLDRDAAKASVPVAIVAKATKATTREGGPYGVSAPKPKASKAKAPASKAPEATPATPEADRWMKQYETQDGPAWSLWERLPGTRAKRIGTARAFEDAQAYIMGGPVPPKVKAPNDASARALAERDTNARASEDAPEATPEATDARVTGPSLPYGMKVYRRDSDPKGKRSWVLDKPIVLGRDIPPAGGYDYKITMPGREPWTVASPYTYRGSVGRR